MRILGGDVYQAPKSTEYRDEYVKVLLKDWGNQLNILSTTAETQPPAAY